MPYSEAAGGPYRRFSHHEREWLVWRLSADEVEALQAPATIVRDWLIFLGPNGETLRLATFPANWSQMSETELSALAAAATRFGDPPYSGGSASEPERTRL
jgi:hypothetical protein